MSDAMLFTSEHITSIAARAAELERVGEELEDPGALVRAARLYTLAIRIADDIDRRDALPFMHSDLARVRDELRMLGDDSVANGRPTDSTGRLTRTFREVALRIEQRLANGAKVAKGSDS